MKEKLKSTRAITLIALIITIIILLILAGVTLNIALGENGLFTKSRQAVDKYKEQAAREKIEMAIASYELARATDPFQFKSQEDVKNYIANEIGGEVTAEGEFLVDGIIFEVIYEETTGKIEIGESRPNNVKRVPTTGITISADPNNNTIRIGENINLTATLEPENTTSKTVTWSSADSKIAQVERTGDKTAKITGTGVGTTKIIAKVEKITQEYTVTVNGIPAEGITIIAEPNVNQIEKGGTIQLTAEVSPENATDKTVEWMSSDKTIATIEGADENGIVTGTNTVVVNGIGSGTTTISAKVGAIVKSYEITVKQIEVQSISLDKTGLELGKGETSEALNVTFNPANADNKTITWTANPTSVATVSQDGKITGVSVGEATITATTSNGKTATCTVTVIPEIIGGIQNGIYKAKGSVAETKLSNSNVAEYYGMKTDYVGRTSVTVGGNTWTVSETYRLFYIDFAGDFGPAGQVYLKADCTSNNQRLPTTENVSEQEEVMKRFNPKWTSINDENNNTKAVAYLLNSNNWAGLKSTQSKYSSATVYGGPSLEIFNKSYTLKYSSNPHTEQISGTGYLVKQGTGAFNYYTPPGTLTDANSHNMYNPGRGKNYWLSSPSTQTNGHVLTVGGRVMAVYVDKESYNAYALCPLVSLSADILVNLVNE